MHFLTNTLHEKIYVKSYLIYVINAPIRGGLLANSSLLFTTNVSSSCGLCNLVHSILNPF